MRTWIITACWLAVAALGAFLRFDDLPARPFHADEATGARITAQRLESSAYAFDPAHYHGPTLSAAAMTVARAHGTTRWAELEKGTLRLVPAVAGWLLVLVPLLGRRRFGDAPMLLAALALATSPLLVYYSRMFIHEVLLALFGALALFQFASTKRWWPAGLWIGLMFATKETFAISMVAWSAAGLALYLAGLRRPDHVPPAEVLKRHGRPALLAAALALVTSLAFYTNGFTYGKGAVDAVRTYFVYDVVDGHDKPFGYYLGLLLPPRELAGRWWSEGAVAVFALAALAAGVFSRSLPAATRTAIRFLALSAAAHALIYSLIAYKTPWLMVLPWAHVCLLAGFAATAVPPRARASAAAASLVLAAGFAFQFLQCRAVNGRLASDERNPYAYVPTSDDIEALGPWLRSLDAAVPELPLTPIGVIGTDYWPLPWYLREYDKVGYWTEPPPSLERLPLVFATTDLADTLAGSHVPVPRGLRTDTPMIVWVRSDFWEASLAAPSDE